jgi:hypothetical protein
VVVATLLADPTTAPEPVTQPSTGAPDGAPPPADGHAAGPAASCARCGAPLAEGQGWCLQCGAAAPGSLGDRSWRPTATIAAVVLALVLGAAAAAYAAMTSSAPKRRTFVATVIAPPAAAAPTATTPGVSPTTPPGTTGTLPGATLPSIVKPPKIPLAQVTPKAAPKVTVPPVSSPKTGTTSTPTGTGGSGSKAAKPTPILLDTNAVSTYNPSGYAPSAFGEPGMAIDGETSTAWTAQVDPAIAPKMAVGLLVDLRTPHHVSAVQVITSTPGITVQVLGSDAATAPATASDPAWVKLMPHPKALAKRHEHITLGQTQHGYRFVLLWISRVPASLAGTSQAPGVVRINELELFPHS